MGGKLSKYLEAGEGLNLEFKRCGGKVEKDVFETLCSFANRQGGSILLGVLDDGSAPGVSPESVVSLERNIVNVVNDPNLFNVAPAIEFESSGRKAATWSSGFGCRWALPCTLSKGRYMTGSPMST